MSGDLQDTWLEDFKSENKVGFLTSLPKGWTSDDLGFS
jgi:hypothetical protein